ncbi:hypothetical protein GQ457_04G024400 [Hibiscus cannabinus]
MTRSMNQVAHVLAREGMISTHDHFWIEDTPPSVMVLVAPLFHLIIVEVSESKKARRADIIFLCVFWTALYMEVL